MVFLPLSDDDPLDRGAAAPVTIGLIVLTVVVFLWQRASGAEADQTITLLWGVVPEVARGELPELDPITRFAPFVTYMFLHGGWLHLAGNMLFLWIFGDNVEDAAGPFAYLVLYLASGVAGALLYVALAVERADPLIGASGAIAGVLGAYLMIRPCATVRVLFLVIVVRMRAAAVILAWFAIQVWNALASSPASSVAWWAHVGGAVAGAALIVVLRRRGVRLFECVPGGRTFVGPWGRR